MQLTQLLALLVLVGLRYSSSMPHTERSLRGRVSRVWRASDIQMQDMSVSAVYDMRIHQIRTRASNTQRCEVGSGVVYRN
jgi:hypothetical protein